MVMEGNGKCVVAQFSEEYTAQGAMSGKCVVHKIVDMMKDCNIYISSRREHYIKCKATVIEICLLYLLGLVKSFSKSP